MYMYVCIFECMNKSSVSLIQHIMDKLEARVGVTVNVAKAIREDKARTSQLLPLMTEVPSKLGAC